MSIGNPLYNPLWHWRDNFEVSVQFRCSVVSDSLRLHGLQHTRLPCPSPAPELAQTHVHWVCDAIQPSHPLSRSLLLLLLLLSCFSHVRLCDPIDGSPAGSVIPGILQARILEWVANSFSNAWKWKGKVKSLSRVPLFVTPWTVAYQAPPFMGFSMQEYWSGVPLPSPLSIIKCQI